MYTCPRLYAHCHHSKEPSQGLYDQTGHTFSWVFFSQRINDDYTYFTCKVWKRSDRISAHLHFLIGQTRTTLQCPSPTTRTTRQQQCRFPRMGLVPITRWWPMPLLTPQMRRRRRVDSVARRNLCCRPNWPVWPFRLVTLVSGVSRVFIGTCIQTVSLGGQPAFINTYMQIGYAVYRYLHPRCLSGWSNCIHQHMYMRSHTRAHTHTHTHRVTVWIVPGSFEIGE